MTVSRQPSHSNSAYAMRFYVSGGAFSFHRQYSKIYAARLSAAKPWLIKSVTRMWNATKSEDPAPEKIPIRSLNHLINNERCIIIGTVYKEMKKKPSILRELASDTTRSVLEHGGGSSNISSDKFFSSDDSLFLEDDFQRILLIIDKERVKSPLSSVNLITGVVVALLGFEPESELGSFQVEDAMFLEPQPERPISTYSCTTQSKSNDFVQFRNSGPWLALVSGLEFTGSGPVRAGHSMALQLLADWLRCSGDWTQNSNDGVGVVRLMILGDSIYSPTSETSHGSLTQQARYLTRNAEADSVTAMTRLDSWLATLPLGPGISATDADSVNGFSVDLLPGPSDPTSSFLPQQPVHAAAFPITRARSAGGLCGRTNPFLCDLFGRKILATSGQGVNDLLCYTDIEDPCDRMEATLLWGHLAPSCPDTLPGYPLVSGDLLLLEQAETSSHVSYSPDYPDIYIAGCQPGATPHWRRASLHWSNRSSNSSAEHGALLVAIPRFSTSRCLVLVHLETFDCRVVHFDTSALDGLED